MMVCSGRLPGAMQLGWPGWMRKPPARFCSRMPVLLETIAEPKRMRDRIDEGADVAILVDHGDVDRRRIHRRRHVRQIEHPVHPDLAAIFVGEFLGQDPRRRRHRHGRDRRCTARASCRRCARLRLRDETARRSSARKFRQIEARQDVQHHQHGDAGAVRRALPDVDGPCRWCRSATVVSVVWAAKSSSVCRPPMPRRVSTMSSAMAPL